MNAQPKVQDYESIAEWRRALRAYLAAAPVDAAAAAAYTETLLACRQYTASQGCPLHGESCAEVKARKARQHEAPTSIAIDPLR